MELKNKLKGRHFINLEDFEGTELLSLIDYASELKAEVKKYRKIDILKDKTLVMYFSKPSLRTRLSFETGIQKLGGHSIVIKQEEIILGKRESIADTSRVISRYADGVTLRTFAHKDVEDFATYSSIPIINALTDVSHPCQIMADLLTIKEYFKTFKGIKVAFVGDGNNVSTTLMLACAMLGIDITLSVPKGYEPDKNYTNLSLEYALKSGSKIEILNDPIIGVKDSQVVYTDTWTSMGQENETNIRNEKFKEFQVNLNLLKNANKEAIVMHCLPAHHGFEITDDVFELNSKVIFDQSENRMHAQMAIMASIM